MNEIPVKRPRGRPRKNPAIEPKIEREPVKTNVLKMRATPNWETIDPLAVDTPDKLYVDPALIPEGMSAMWVTDSVLGQQVPQHRAEFERKGWTPVHQDDFDGQFDGRYMPKGRPGEINVEGMVMMMRPKELTKKAELAEKRKAQLQVAIKEQALTGGDLPGVSMDTRHATVNNRIRRSVEQIDIPD